MEERFKFIREELFEKIQHDIYNHEHPMEAETRKIENDLNTLTEMVLEVLKENEELINVQEENRQLKERLKNLGLI